jgi:hypothetical protein
MTQRLIESFRQNLVLPQHALPLEQMSDTGTERLVFVTSLLYFRNPSFRLSADSLQLMPFLRGQLRALRGKDFAGGDLPQFPRTRLARDQSDFPHRGLSRLPLLELFDFTFDFLPPLGKTLAERGRDPFDLKTSDFAVLPCLPDAVARSPGLIIRSFRRESHKETHKTQR